MNSEWLPRLLVAIIIFGSGVTAYLLLNRFLLNRVENRLQQFAAYRPGLPTLLYFTSPTCIPCRTQQRPIIEQLQERFGRWFQVIEVDAVAQPEVAIQWGIVSAPTTFVFDAQGRPRHVNHGVTGAKTLIKQLNLEEFSP